MWKVFNYGAMVISFGWAFWFFSYAYRTHVDMSVGTASVWEILFLVGASMVGLVLAVGWGVIYLTGKIMKKPTHLAKYMFLPNLIWCVLAGMSLLIKM